MGFLPFLCEKVLIWFRFGLDLSLYGYAGIRILFEFGLFGILCIGSGRSVSNLNTSCTPKILPGVSELSLRESGYFVSSCRL